MGYLKQRSTTKEQLLSNTINYFNSKNRCTLADGTCAYRNKKGEACAIGREISTTLAKKIEGYSVDQLVCFEKLPKRLKNMGRLFLDDIQNLHDESKHWNVEGLSITGIKRVQYIIDTHNLNPSKIISNIKILNYVTK